MGWGSIVGTGIGHCISEAFNFDLLHKVEKTGKGENKVKDWLEIWGNISIDRVEEIDEEWKLFCDFITYIWLLKFFLRGK